MKLINKKKGAVVLMAVIMMFSVSSCDLFDLDINTDPNNPTQASLELLLANSMLNGADTYANGLNRAASGFMGHITSFDVFDMDNTDWNSTWNFLYENPLNDLERVIVAATEQGNNPHVLGVAQVLKAYYFSIMVDMWGGVPYEEAFKGDQGIKQPAYTVDSEIYADLIQLCDAAVANFALTSAVAVRGDLIHGGTIAKWKKTAKSLKLRLLLQMRRAPGANVTADIQTLVTEGDLILTAGDDFQFKFGRLQNPDDRHPWYRAGYSGGEAGFDYFGHQLMFEMLRNRDPRTPFYFKRQTTAVLNQEDPTDKQTTPCSQRDDCLYNYFPLSNLVANGVFGENAEDLNEDEVAYLAGFFGRDRSDPSGVPNDNPIRTTVGAYPAAGLFDDVAEAGGGNKGAGDGIFPMITSWMVKFYILEARISLGVTTPASMGTEADILKSALTDQVNKVFSVGTAADAAALPNVADWDYDWPLTYRTQTAFVNAVVDGIGGNTLFPGYPTAGSESQRLNFVLKQAWYANYGNGFEIYNAFRRTGFPNDLQEPLQIPRQFALRIPYAQDELNLNPQTPTIVYDSPSDAIFWDALKFQF